MIGGIGPMRTLSGSQWRPSVAQRPLTKQAIARAARSSQADVFESLTLLEFSADASAVSPLACASPPQPPPPPPPIPSPPHHPPDLFSPRPSQEDVAQLVDGIWSLQFTAAGPICSTAGQLLPLGPAAAAPASQNAVLFRYASQAAAERFQAQPRVQLMLGGTGAPEGSGEWVRALHSAATSHTAEVPSHCCIPCCRPHNNQLPGAGAQRLGIHLQAGKRLGERGGARAGVGPPAAAGTAAGGGHCQRGR